MARLFHAMQGTTQLGGGPLGGGGRIVQLVSKPCRQLSQAGQSIALLFKTSSLANTVCHHSDQALGQLRHFLNELREQRTWKSQDAAVGDSPSGHGELLHARKG